MSLSLCQVFSLSTSPLKVFSMCDSEFSSYLSTTSFPLQHVESSTTFSPSHSISGNAAKKDL